MSASMAATLVAFFALGFFAATLLPLARFLTLLTSAAVAVFGVAVSQGTTMLDGLELACGGFMLAQIGFGVGLAWMATHTHYVPD